LDPSASHSIRLPGGITLVSVAKSALQSMEDEIGDLPMLPQVLVGILQLDPDANNFFEEFGKLAKEDPAFAVRLIALANSAASSPAVPVVSIRDALSRMGTKAIRNLVASLAVQRVFMPSKPNEVSLWQHSVYAAFAAAMIAEIASDLKIDPAEAYLVGLLHDIGRFVMFEHAALDLLKVDESHWETPEQLIEADVDIYKFTHCELGFRACTHWKLPVSICEVVRLHHTPIEREIVAGSPDALLFCVQVADQLCLSILQRDDFDDMPDDIREQRILDNCLKTERQKVQLPAALLTAKLNRIYTDSQALLSGLGFNCRKKL
jgi:HD-like signal output (HDOD) protein